MIYLLHFTVHLGGSGSSGADHYLGWCPEDGLEDRLQRHHTLTHGAAITRAVLEQGGDLVLVRTWPNGGKALERYLKNNGHLAKHCPICRGKHLKRQREQWHRRAKRRSQLLELPLVRPRLTSGGVSPALSMTTPYSDRAGWYHPAQPPASGTGSGVAGLVRANGGRSSTAHVRPSPPASTSSAGTRQRSS